MAEKIGQYKPVEVGNNFETFEYVSIGPVAVMRELYMRKLESWQHLATSRRLTSQRFR